MESRDRPVAGLVRIQRILLAVRRRRRGKRQEKYGAKSEFEGSVGFCDGKSVF